MASTDPLESFNPQTATDDFLEANKGNSFLDNLANSLRSIGSEKLTALIQSILDCITDGLARSHILSTLKQYIINNPFQLAFCLVCTVLTFNPVMARRIVSLTPVAGVLATYWRTSVGSEISSQTAFNMLLQNAVLSKVNLPVLYNNGITVVKPIVEDAGRVTHEAAGHIDKWKKGEYGTPVKDWREGKHGNAVSDWWGGKFGNPVGDWIGHVTKRN